MASIWQNLQLGCAVCKILTYSTCRRLCCGAPPPPRPEFSLVCIGLTGAGKSTLLAVACGEPTENIEPTSGFTIKAVQLPRCILNIKEIGGSEKIRPFWKHYYKEAEAVIFVIDAACSDDEMIISSKALTEALSNPQLRGLACLILASCQDKQGARPETQICEELALEETCQGRQWLIHSSCMQDKKAVMEGLTKLSTHLIQPAENSKAEQNAGNRI